MAVETREEEGRLIVSITGSITVYEVAEVRDGLLAALMRGSEVTLALDAVDACDTAGVQLLLSTARALEKGGQGMRVTGVPDAVSQAMERIGVDLRVFDMASEEV